MAIVKLTPTKGLALEPDTSPYTATTLSEDAEIIDGVRYTAATGAYWYTHYSYGVELSSTEASYDVYRIECFGSLSVTPTDWYDTSHDSFQVFASTNNSTWTFIEQFDAPTLHHLGSLQYGFKLELSVPQDAKYWKVVYVDSTTVAFLPGGSSALIGEIELYGDSFVGCFSGYVYEKSTPVQRQLYLHRRDTGALVDETTSSGNGYYYLATTWSGSHCIVCLDDDAGDSYDALVIGSVIPTTVSG